MAILPRRSRTTMRTRLAILALLAVLVLTGLAIFGDAGELVTALAAFPLPLLVPILALTLFNYALRYLKWRFYLSRLGVQGITWGESALVFLAGFSMSVTPGKVGEFIKCLLLRRITGAPVSRTSAILVAERITDGLAMLLLAAVGILQFSYGRTFLALAVLGAGGAVIILQRPELATRALSRLSGFNSGARLLRPATSFLAASQSLLRPGLLATAVSLGTVSWAAECFALFLVLVGLGIEPSAHILLVAVFVLAVSSIAGAVSMLPGGLGVAEASVAGMLLFLVEDDAMNRGVAAAATLIIRFATLWFAVLIGALALAVLQRKLAGREMAPATSLSVDAG
ncbi:MAG: flippase-like domain-containing protein, partial [Chloroflexota bacterium]|nr:flippase-like domain-containing protein [Chloroflexota bacterium]